TLRDLQLPRAAEQVQVEALRFRRPVRDGLEAQVEEAAARQVEPRLEPLFLAVDERPGAQGLFPEPAQAAGGGGVDDDVLELHGARLLAPVGSLSGRTTQRSDHSAGGTGLGFGVRSATKAGARGRCPGHRAMRPGPAPAARAGPARRAAPATGRRPPPDPAADTASAPSGSRNGRRAPAR